MFIAIGSPLSAMTIAAIWLCWGAGAKAAGAAASTSSIDASQRKKQIITVVPPVFRSHRPCEAGTCLCRAADDNLPSGGISCQVGVSPVT